MRLLGKLLPRGRFTLTGTLQAQSARGAGVTLSLNGQRDGTGVTLWSGPEPEFADDLNAQRFQSLAVPVAAWTDFVLRKELGDPLPSVSDDAASWALHRAGLACEDAEDKDGAIRYYEAAAQADAHNYASRANLAKLLSREPERRGEALETYDDALRALRTRP